LHLTGTSKDGPLILTGSANDPGVLVKPTEVWLAQQNATLTMDEVESGKLASCVLIWVVLMQGGGEPQNIDRWKRLVEREPDAEMRAKFRAFALVFAELIPELVHWQRALEGWQLRESQYLKSFEDRGEQRGEARTRRADLIRVLQFNLKTPAPEPIRLAIEGTNDLGILDRWFDEALKAASWVEFEAAMKRGPQT
jgi:hypothetical protein